MLLDQYGLRLTYSILPIDALMSCLIFATAQSFNQLVIGRFLVGLVGAGFVVGIRMVVEWFPPQDVGTAQGIYGDWGNFGSAFAAFTMVIFGIALFLIPGAFSFGEPETFKLLFFPAFDTSMFNWRAAIAGSGIVAALCGCLYSVSVSDTPPGKEYKRLEKARGIEVSTKCDFGCLVANVNATFFQVLGVGGLIVAFLCLFSLKEPRGAFAEFHEGEDELSNVPVANEVSY